MTENQDSEQFFWKKILPKIPGEYLFDKGGRKYPFHLLTSNYKPNFKLGKNLFIEYKKQRYILPSELKSIGKKVIQPEIERRKRLRWPWYSDTICKLSDIQVSDKADKHKVYLTLGITSYEDHFVSNLNLNNQILRGRETIRDRFTDGINDIAHLCDKLSNPLATNIFVVNRKQMKGIICERSDHVTFRRGFYCIAGGYIILNDKKDLDEKGVPDPFRAAKRETIREIGLEIENLTCLGIGIDLVYGYPDILFLAETSDPIERVYSVRKPEEKEIRKYHVVNLRNSKEISRFLDNPRKIGTHDAVCIILALEHLSLGEIQTTNFDIYKTNYDIVIQRMPHNNRKGIMVINGNMDKTIELTEQMTDICIFMAQKLKRDAKIKKIGKGYVSRKEFQSKLGYWSSGGNPDSNVRTQIFKLRKRIKDAGFNPSFIQSLQRAKPTTYRISTPPEKVAFKEVKDRTKSDESPVAATRDF